MHLELIFDDLGDFAQAYRGRISVEGMLLFCSAPLPSGTVIDLSIALRDGLVLISGRGGVLRTSIGTFTGRELHTAALRFVHLDQDSTALIQRMEERHATEGVRPFNLEEALTHWGRVGGTEHDAAGRPLPTTRLSESSAAADKGEPLRPTDDTRQPAPQRPLELYDMVTSALDDEARRPAAADATAAKERAERPHEAARRGLPGPVLAVLAAVAVAAVVIAVVLRFFPDFIVPGADDSDITQPTVAVAPSPTNPLTGGIVTTPVEPELVATEAIAQTTGSPDTAGILDPTQPPPTTATPPPATATPTPAPPLEARAVRELSWQQQGDRTIVTIHCDQPLRPERLTRFLLTDPPGPRYVLQISGIESSDLPYTTRGDGTRITAIRAWHHTEQTPPSLHIVTDLAAETVTLDELRLDGDDLVLIFSSQ